MAVNVNFTTANCNWVPRQGNEAQLAPTNCFSGMGEVEEAMEAGREGGGRGVRVESDQNVNVQMKIQLSALRTLQ